MEKFKESIIELQEFLIEKAVNEQKLDNLRRELAEKKESIQKAFIHLFDEVYYELRTNIGKQIQFNRVLETDDYNDDLSAEYTIGDFNISIKFNIDDCELMEVIIEMKSEIHEIDDELTYEVTKYDNRWVWLDDRELLTTEMLLDDIKDIMMS